MPEAICLQHLLKDPQATIEATVNSHCLSSQTSALFVKKEKAALER